MWETAVIKDSWNNPHFLNSKSPHRTSELDPHRVSHNWKALVLRKKLVTLHSSFWLITYMLNPSWIQLNTFFILVNSCLKSKFKMNQQILHTHSSILDFILASSILDSSLKVLPNIISTLQHIVKSPFKEQKLYITCIAPSCAHTRWHNCPFISCWIIIFHCW